MYADSVRAPASYIGEVHEANEDIVPKTNLVPFPTSPKLGLKPGKASMKGWIIAGMNCMNNQFRGIVFRAGSKSLLHFKLPLKFNFCIAFLTLSNFIFFKLTLYMETLLWKFKVDKSSD